MFSWKVAVNFDVDKSNNAVCTVNIYHYIYLEYLDSISNIYLEYLE